LASVPRLVFSPNPFSFVCFCHPMAVLVLSPESVTEPRFIQFLCHFFGLPPKRAVLKDFGLCSVSGIRAHSARQSTLSCLQPPPCFDCCSIYAPVLVILDPRPVLSARSSSASISWPIPGSSSVSFPARDAHQDVLLACSFGFSFARVSSPFLSLCSEYSLSCGIVSAAAESERSSCQRRLVLRLQIFLYRSALRLGSVQLLRRLLFEYRLSLQASIFL
jgi:hypothetical protein